MSQIYSVYKPISQTPLQALQKLQSLKNLGSKKLTYAGRLDPMAHGVQLVISQPSHEIVSKVKSYPKTYKTQVVFGIETDTFDLMGISKKISNTTPSKEEITREFKKKLGMYNQPYPPFSATKVDGQPLHYWAKHQLLKDIQIPNHEVTVHELEVSSFKTIKGEEILTKAKKYIPQVKGSFRQKTILRHWENHIQSYPNQDYLMCSVKCHVSSGTYIRQLIHEVGNELKTGAFCFDILRTTVGPYTLKAAERIYD